ncbi:MAG: sugar phosphate isomerase/epimerase [Planctomycetes bacterium]|nr:sugar phosphate isomerase/epimerase [Planctomycetota bacterium]
MKLGVCAQVFYERPLEEALSAARELGFETLELPVDARSPWIDLDELLTGGAARLEAQLTRAGFALSALSNHQEGQLLLGPHGVDTDAMFRGSPAEKTAYAERRLLRSAELARRLGLDTVLGFTGCEDYARWFPWPLEDGYERMGPPFRERMLPLLDAFHTLGVRFAHECHPRQLAYNTETALWTLELLDRHPAWCFNFDPANLLLAGVDPVQFVSELGDRIVHVHAKDGQLVPQHARRSGLLAHGPWHREGRGFRFRVPGWGDLDWRALITELRLAGYDGVLSVEHEDPTFGRRDGLEQALRHLTPLIPREPMPEGRWW